MVDTYKAKVKQKDKISNLIEDKIKREKKHLSKCLLCT